MGHEVRPEFRLKPETAPNPGQSEKGTVIIMQNFIFEDTEMNGVKLITPFFLEDQRGSFLKCFEKEVFRNNGIEFEPFECFESFSVKNVLRGLHFQTKDPQAKLVRVLHGEVYDVVVDLRQNSPDFGKWKAFILSSENKEMLYIPKGFAHGFLVLSKNAVMQYTCSGKFYSEYDSGLYFNDDDIKIDWRISDFSEIIISEKDKNLQSFKEFKEKFYFDM